MGIEIKKNKFVEQRRAAARTSQKRQLLSKALGYNRSNSNQVLDSNTDQQYEKKNKKERIQEHGIKQGHSWQAFSATGK